MFRKAKSNIGPYAYGVVFIENQICNYLLNQINNKYFIFSYI